MTDARLPEGFGDLEPFAVRWCLESMAQRSALRLGSALDELDRLYTAVVERMDDVLTHLAAFPADRPLPPPEHNLYLLACAFMEISPAVELFRAADVPDGFPAGKFEILSG